MRKILVGGNHLANMLIGHYCYPDQQTSYEQVLRDFGPDCADVWICWKAIMDWKDECAPRHVIQFPAEVNYMAGSTNKGQHHEGRMRDEGSDGKHMREDGGVPIMGKKGASIHGAHTGEMHHGTIDGATEHAGKGHGYSGVDKGTEKPHRGKDDSEK
jgi:hypothetical protein